MPLDRQDGEIVGDLGPNYRVVPAVKWCDSPFWPIAVEDARRAFQAAGSLYYNPRADDVLVQEYPETNRVAFLFCREIKGQEMIYPAVFSLPEPVINSLVVTGRWSRDLPTQH